jgi:FAD/FMN-containing dehydrogenase
MDVSDLDKSLPRSAINAEVLFGGNYPKMQEIKKRYDPDNVFSKWFSITPA